MEVDEDGLDSDSGSEPGDDDMVSEAQIADFEAKLTEEPFNYAAHVGLVAALRSAGDLDKLRAARENFASKFPLSPTLWLDYIKDEMMASSGDDANSRELIDQLFNRAMADYQSIDIWLEYMQWACGSSLEDARKVFERALTAVGLQADKGALIWDLYREFEIAVLGAMSGPIAEDQRQKVDKIFRRQLSIPLIGMEQTWMEYLEYLKETNTQPEAFVRKAYEKALERLPQIKKFEDSLDSSDGSSSIEAFNAYLDAEVKEGDPGRVQSLFERAVAANCLDTALWVRYVTWLDTKLKIHEVILPVYARAVRNCPWSTALWTRYLMSMERAGRPVAEIDAVWATAAESGFSTSAEGIELFLTYTYLLKRRVDNNGGTDYGQAQASFVDGASRLQTTFGERDWDPEASFRKSWAYFEAVKCGNITKARELWQDVLASGSGPYASAWIEAVAVERQAGDVEHARKLLLRAVNSVSDYPEVVCHALLQFEREEGTLNDLDAATARIDAQLARVAERRRQGGGAEGKEKRPPKKQQQQHATQKADNGRDGFGAPSKGADRRSPQKRPAPTDHPSKMEAAPTTDKDGFTVPSAPFAPPQKKARAAENDSQQQQQQQREKGDAIDATSSSSTDQKKGDASHTVFVSNLDFKVPDERFVLFFDVSMT
uniref:Squamous cell carcinoma antigen recognized by T-cells 3 n=1 Tax=Plectus sambesii TaxID=2011161 RepID=A0A914X447_9BILA